MDKLPTDVSGRDLRRALERAGFVFRRQRGSHIPFARVVVPDHRALRPGTLRRIVADAGMTVSELLRLLGESKQSPIGKAAGVLIGLQSEDEWFEYRLETDPRFPRRIEEARAAIRAGRGVRLKDVGY